MDKRSELYDELELALAPLVIMSDISMAHQSNTQVMIHADELASMLIAITKHIKTVQEKLYQI